MKQKLNPENPRISILEAEDLYYTPRTIRGIKPKVAELFKKALEQFKTYKIKSLIQVPEDKVKQIILSLRQNKLSIRFFRPFLRSNKGFYF